MEPENDRVLSVFELAQGLKRTVENATSGRWVEGEVGRLQRPVSGHLYFSLKDERRDAAIDCVMYKRDALRFGAHLREGARVQIRGRATFYAPRGRLQWIAEVVRAAGQGALLEKLERLKQKLIDEGLTSEERKQALPADPRVLGVVTTATGAAFSDICTVALTRGRIRIVLAPAIVQGEEASASIIRALDLMERSCPDVIILGRGGGSQEDLMAFNDEAVVRRVAACSVPIVSAVGHEIDTSLTDLVADARAATPSQAAEMVVPDAAERKAALARVKNHMTRAMHARLTETQLFLDRERHKLGDPRFVLANEQQALDELRLRLSRKSSTIVARGREELEIRSRRLYARHPRAVLADARARLGPTRERLYATMRRGMDSRESSLQKAGRALSALSPLSILGRGYALAIRPDGRALREVDSLEIGEVLRIRLQKGAFSARVEKVLSTVENAAAFDHESSTAPLAEGDPEL